jgi:hypothetical protein
MKEGSNYAESLDARVSLLLTIRQFKDAVTTHFERSKDVTPAISDDGYSNFQEEGRRIANQHVLIKRELLKIFDLTKGPFSELYPAMVRDYTAVSLYCLTTAWNARPDLENYGSPAVGGRQADHHDWKSLFRSSIADLQARFPHIGMTPGDINGHHMVFRLCCDEIVGEFPMSDQQEARRREAEMNPKTVSYNVYGPAGAVGENARAHDFTIQHQSRDEVELRELSKQLDELRLKMKDVDKDNRDIEIGAVAAAVRAAEKGDRSGMMASLRTAGNWAYELAKELGVKLAAETIASAIKSP